MKKILLITTLNIFFTSAKIVAQIDITVSTDTTEYQVLDTIFISITAHNPTTSTITLYFNDFGQAEYYVDSFYSGSIHVYPHVPTEVTILPGSTYTWSYEHTSDIYHLDAGTHSIIGEVIGYGLSDTITVFVKQTTNIGYESRCVPQTFKLFQNYPNPFNPSTTISYSIPNSNFITLKIYDVLGKEIQTLVHEFQEANTYSVNFNTNKLSSSVYFYKLQVGNDFKETKKMLFLR
jgi:hypothetical protein